MQIAMIILGAVLILAGLIFIILDFKKKRRNKKRPQPFTLNLEKSRKNLGERVGTLFKSHTQLDSQALAELEEILISADVGVATTQKLLTTLQERQNKVGGQNAVDLCQSLLEEVVALLDWEVPTVSWEQRPHVILVLGVNGAGKTTTIAKLSQHYRHQGKQVLLAAADTFRAGAIDQLKVWAERVGAQTLSQQEGADPSSVAFDAVKSGAARAIDVVIIDTAGRLHTQINLMEELKKVRRVVEKALPGAPHEVLLVLDGTQGQNALQQARKFHEAMNITGLIITKLDGTPKGGMVIGISDELKIPVQWIGIGEKLDDLKEFQPRPFAEALLN